MAVPVHIVSGFLGTGKTSAIRAQLEQRSGERIAVIVNDFGEASLDEATLAESGPFRITQIPGGCVCCTAPEGFVDALGAVLDSQPDRILIEPTGLARPQDLVDTLRRCAHGARVALAPVVVLVDPGRVGREAEAERAVVEHQITCADVVVANRTDVCGDEALERFDAWVAGLWPAPLAVHRTRHGRIPPELMEWPAGEGPRIAREASGHDHGHSTEGYAATSRRWPPERIFSRERLHGALERLAAGQAGAPLARFKGIFRTSEGVLRIEWAGGSLHESPSSHRRDSRADVIFECEGGAAGERAFGWIEAAALSASELEARAHQIEISAPDGRSWVMDRGRLESLEGGVADVSALFPKRNGSAARVGALLRELGIASRGQAVVVAADGFASEPVALTALAEGLLLHSIGGEALSGAQGGPFRLLIPEGVEGAPSSCANVKGVVRIVLRD